MRTSGRPRPASGASQVPGRGPGAPARSLPVAPLLARVGAVQAEIAAAPADLVLDRAARLTADLLDADGVLVGVRDGDEVVAEARAGDHFPALVVGRRIPMQGTLVGLSVRTGEAQLCFDGSADPRTDAELNAAHGIGSSVVAPLVQGTVAVGVLSAVSARAGHFDETHLRLLELCAAATSARLAQALELAVHERLRDELAYEEALRGTVLDALDEGILVRDVAEDRVVLANAACRRMLGAGDDGVGQVLARPGWRLVAADGSDLPHDERPSAITRRTGMPCRERLLGIEDPSGSTRWLSASALPLRHPVTGELTRVVTRFADVTAARAAQQALARSEERLSTAQRITGLAWWEYDVVADRHVWSPQMSRLVGMDPHGPAPTQEQFLACVHPDDRARVEAHPEADDPSGVQGRLFRVRRLDGQERVLQSWSYVVREEAGRLRSVFGTTLDVTDREDAASALRLSEQQFRVAFEDAPIGMTMVALDGGAPGTVLRANAAFCDLVGYDLADLTRLRLPDWTLPDDLDRDAARLQAVIDGSVDSVGYEKRYLRSDGTVRHAWVTSSLTRGDDGSPLYLFSHIVDVTEREAATRAVAANEQMFRVAFEHAPTGMTLVSLRPGSEGVVVRANKVIASMVGRTVDDLVGGQMARLVHPDDLAAGLAFRDDAAAGRDAAGPRQRRLVHADGHTVHVALSNAVLEDVDGQGPYVITHAVDVTASRAQQQELERLARTDILTGLANRATLERAVRAALRDRRAGEPGRRVALLLLDLDRFKLVNDSLGHHVGDVLLVEVARRLREVAGPGVTVARLGGDEFVVLLTGVRDPGAAWDVADRVLTRLRAPYELSTGHRLVSTVSLGISVGATATQGPSDLLREADLALYRAKDAGRDRVAVYDDALRARAVARLDAEDRLRRALAGDGDGVEVQLQPIVSLHDEQPRSWEALARVRDPEKGLLPPDVFMEVAEETGLVVDLDTTVMERSVALLAAGTCSQVAVNVSCRTLEQPGWIARLRSALARHGVAGERLLVEITESTLLEGSPVVDRTLADLRTLGVRVGLDDFGTGYSALAYLQRFELDFLKVDRSFVAQLGLSDRADATMRAVVDLAHAHGLVVTAEGVETREQADVLRGMGCDLGQGWLFGRPARP